MNVFRSFTLFLVLPLVLQAFSSVSWASPRPDAPQTGLILAKSNPPLETEPLSDGSTPEGDAGIAQPKAVLPNVRGWDYLAHKLIVAGTPVSEVVAVFTDPRMPTRSPVPFKLKPRETKQMYSSFTTEPRLKVARECLANNLPSFIAAEHAYHVNRYVLAALLYIETHCGKIVGDNLVVNRLARVSSVGEPANIDYNVELVRREYPSATREDVEARARYLEETFFPELQAIFEVVHKKQVDIFDLKGSVAGAFGIPQFLPSSYLKFGVDGNNDGKVWLFDHADAILSAAHFLHHFGWKDSGTLQERKKALWHYNRSDAYGDAILKVSIILKQPQPAQANKAAKKKSVVPPKPPTKKARS